MIPVDTAVNHLIVAMKFFLLPISTACNFLKHSTHLRTTLHYRQSRRLLHISGVATLQWVPLHNKSLHLPEECHATFFLFYRNIHSPIMFANLHSNRKLYTMHHLIFGRCGGRLMQSRENRLTLSEAVEIALTIFRLFSVTAAVSTRYFIHSVVEKFNYLPHGHLINHKFCAPSFEVPIRFASRLPHDARRSGVVDNFCYEVVMMPFWLMSKGDPRDLCCLSHKLPSRNVRAYQCWAKIL